MNYKCNVDCNWRVLSYVWGDRCVRVNIIPYPLKTFIEHYQQARETMEKGSFRVFVSFLFSGVRACLPDNNKKNTGNNTNNLYSGICNLKASLRMLAHMKHIYMNRATLYERVYNCKFTPTDVVVSRMTGRRRPSLNDLPYIRQRAQRRRHLAASVTNCRRSVISISGSLLAKALRAIAAPQDKIWPADRRAS